MTAHNKLDKAFGPTGSWAGITLFMIGIITAFTSLFGLILVVLGAFMGFSSTSTIIDFEGRRIKFSNNLFGILQTGKWLPVESWMKIGIRESSITWRTYSRGNRSLDINSKDFRIVLIDSDMKEIMPLKKSGTLELAKAELVELCQKLDLSAIE